MLQNRVSDNQMDRDLYTSTLKYSYNNQAYRFKYTFRFDLVLNQMILYFKL